MTDAVKNILNNYSLENVKIKQNLSKLLMTGCLAGTGKLVILPVDQGFEHGPARSFATNSAGYDPEYHVNLALDAGCNGYAAPYGFIQQVAKRYAEKIPLILKLNNHDSVVNEDDPIPALTSTVADAVRLGCTAVGYTIYPGSKQWRQMYSILREVRLEAIKNGLPLIVWSYPRGTDLSKEGETAIDIVAYAAHLAAQMGAHIIKVKLPTAEIEQESAQKVYNEENVPIATLTERVKHVTQAAFAGKRIVIFSGGGKKEDNEVFTEIKAIRDGGGFGSIIGRNSFQRPHDEAVKFLNTITSIYKGTE